MLKKVDQRQTSTSLAVSGSMTSLIILMDSPRGIFVNKETTSKLMMISSGSTLSFLMIVMKLEESLINEFVLPTKGPRVFATYFAS
jgi:hypothetical protein